MRSIHTHKRLNSGLTHSQSLTHQIIKAGTLSITVFACEAGLWSMPTLHQQIHRLQYDLDTNCLQKSEGSEKDAHSKVENTSKSQLFGFIPWPIQNARLKIPHNKTKGEKKQDNGYLISAMSEK